MDTTIFVGLDVHKKTISVATVEARASADVRFYGTIPNTPGRRALQHHSGEQGQGPGEHPDRPGPAKPFEASSAGPSLSVRSDNAGALLAGAMNLIRVGLSGAGDSGRSGLS
jgi:hypothetical protein